MNPQNAQSYLTLPNVLCVGGSWMLKPELIATKNWPAIENLARQACLLKGA
ncbi:hypothetical protein [Acidocella sp.]|uniref:hypothetical protein n=1 Tax=Acidocella sp. TaxID=50710 RepID=UPI00345C7278